MSIQVNTLPDTVQLDRYRFFADQDGTNADATLTKDSRERSDLQTIGMDSSRDFSKDKLILQLKEYSGPSNPSIPNSPSSFRIPVKQVLIAQRKLWEYGQKAFHDSIGSSMLFDDFHRWKDRVYINELLSTTYTYNPNGFADGATVDLNTNSYGGLPPKWTVKDSDEVVTKMTERNVPRFEDGNFACLCTPRFLAHLRRDTEFREVARYPGAVPVSALVPGAEPMQPYQIPFVNGSPAGMAATPFQGGLMQGQAADVGGMTTMPTGFVFNGVRYFVSNNLPKATVTLNYSNQGAGITGGSASRSGEVGIFFGRECIGVGLGGPGPEIRINNNDDYQRFIIAIWTMYGAWKLLDPRFVQVGRSYTT